MEASIHIKAISRSEAHINQTEANVSSASPLKEMSKFDRELLDLQQSIPREKPSPVSSWHRAFLD